MRPKKIMRRFRYLEEKFAFYQKEISTGKIFRIWESATSYMGTPNETTEYMIYEWTRYVDGIKPLRIWRDAKRFTSVRNVPAYIRQREIRKRRIVVLEELLSLQKAKKQIRLC